MKYMGSKNRHSKVLIPILLANRYLGQYYIEPFCGGFNVIDKVEGNRIANDSHFYLVELFRAIQKGWIPPEVVSESEYLWLKNNKTKVLPRLVGFVGFGCSYSGKWFGGFARSQKGPQRNYAAESQRNLLKQAKKISGIIIQNKDYSQITLPAKSIIYCDPPYQGTTKYSTEFDYKRFWDWCRAKTEGGHTVFISEYNAPADFECIWNKKVNNTLVQQTGSKQGVEKLFKLRRKKA